MNRGNIPGYYWDESRQRYFRIQANHLVPDGAKYAKGNVKQEKRSTKKRKIRKDRRMRRENQTVVRAPLLQSASIGGIGLQREHGLHLKSSRSLMQSEAALVAHLIPERIEVKWPGSSRDTRLQDVHYISETKQTVVASAHAYSGVSALYTCDWEWEAASENGMVQVPSYGIAAFNSTISTISTSNYMNLPRVLACADQHQVGNVFMGLLPQACEVNDTSPGVYLTLGDPGSTLADSATHPTTGTAAVIGTGGIFIIDPQANVVNSRPKSPRKKEWPRCAPCINWLNPNTVLYGAKPKHGCHSVMLWDIRTPDGKEPRFDVRERITRVFNPTKFGLDGLGDEHQILASANYHLDLFDTRMPRGRTEDAPVLSFEHIHGGPRLQGAAYGNFVAAVDGDNVIQVYSIRSGIALGSLSAPEWKPKRLESPVFRQLMWYDNDKNGPTLQAVRGNGVVRWSWGEARDEEV